MLLYIASDAEHYTVPRRASHNDCNVNDALKSCAVNNLNAQTWQGGRKRAS